MKLYLLLQEPICRNVSQVLADGRVSYNGQAVGIVVAASSGAARQAAALVSITYSDEKTPVLTIAEALAKGLPPNQPAPFVEGDVAGGNEVPEGN